MGNADELMRIWRAPGSTRPTRQLGRVAARRGGRAGCAGGSLAGGSLPGGRLGRRWGGPRARGKWAREINAESGRSIGEPTRQVEAGRPPSRSSPARSPADPWEMGFAECRTPAARLIAYALWLRWNHFAATVFWDGDNADFRGCGV